MKELKQGITEAARAAFAEGKAGFFVGYEQGSSPVQTTPCFLTPADDVSGLTWNGFCSNNLAVYLPRLVSRSRTGPTGQTVGIVLKGCDSRSVVNLVKEGQVKRDALFIVGVACAGILDAEKLLAAVGDGAVTNVEEDDDTIVVTSRSGTKRLKRTDYLSLSCKACEHPVPSVYDKLVGEAPSGFQSPIVNRQSSIARDFLAKPRAERWREFEAELGKCIRCYACRQACPNCYCRECFAEQTRPKWLGVTSELSDVMFYHIGRIFHQAGRCVDCGACARACPTGVNLRLFTSLLADEVKARFGTEPGLSLEEPSPLLTHRMDDRQEFMVEPERG